MAISSKFVKHNEYSQVTTRPLTLDEVLRLRDGMGIQRPSDSPPLYQTKIIAFNERILLTLN